MKRAAERKRIVPKRSKWACSKIIGFLILTLIAGSVGMKDVGDKNKASFQLIIPWSYGLPWNRIFLLLVKAKYSLTKKLFSFSVYCLETIVCLYVAHNIIYSVPAFSPCIPEYPYLVGIVLRFCMLCFPYV